MSNTTFRYNIDPELLYSTKELGEFLRLQNLNHLGKIPTEDLPIRWVGGPTRGSKRYLGGDIVAYIDAGLVAGTNTNKENR